MKTMFANLNAIVGDTLADSIQMIDIDELHESKDNFFAIDRIEEFAETILGQGGVKDNLIVRPLESGSYEIISGHRRKAAVQYLLDNGENISRYLPCLVQDYSDDDTRMLDLILMNISSRQISDTELWQSYEILNKILQNKKKSGEKFGRVRDKLAELLGVSSTQIWKMENIKRNAVPSVVDAIQNGELSIFTANEVAKMDTDEQEKLVEQGNLSDVKHKDIKKRNEGMKKSVTSNTISEPDTEPENDFQKDESEKSVTSNTISEPDTESENDFQKDESEKSVTSNTISEPDTEPENEFQKDEPEILKKGNSAGFVLGVPADGKEFTVEPVNVTDTLSHFIHEHYFELETVFTAYTSITDSEDEIQMIEEFQELLHKVKEAEREKIRFGV